jgi:hypothetical protein
MKPKVIHPQSILCGAEAWQGWLLLAGGIPALDPPAAPLLNKLAELGLAAENLLCLAPDEGLPAELPGFLDGLEVLLEAPIQRATPSAGEPVIKAEFAVLAGGSPGEWARMYQDTALGESLGACLQLGGCLLCCGPAAVALGDWLLEDNEVHQEGAPPQGAGWLPGAAVLIGTSHPGGHPQARRLLGLRPEAYVLALDAASVLGLGPEGQIEPLAPPAPGVLLGSGWRQE